MKQKRALTEGSMCAQCGKPGLTLSRRPHAWSYKGATFKIENYGVFACPTCGEEYLDDVLIMETEPQIRDWQRQVDGFLTTDELKALRKKIGASRTELSRIFGDEPQCFTKYETGVLNQGAATDQLLRLIRDVPGVWENLKQQSEERRRVEQRHRRRTSLKRAA